MSTGGVFGDGNTVEVPFGTAPSNSGNRFPDGDRVQLTSVGQFGDEEFDVMRIRNDTDEEITVILIVPGAPDEGPFVIPPSTDLIVCTQSTDGGLFRLRDAETNQQLAQTSASNNPFDPTFNICFAPGTLIATPDGERAVETLAIGDPILTASGRTVPVRWIGRQTIVPVFAPLERFAPVRVTAGALGNGLPHTDLVLSAEHALILDGLAIDAGALVNGTTILRDPIDSLPERIVYFHIETAAHDVILANGVPAETFVDYAGRRSFDNFDEYLRLYGDAPTIAEMPLPRVSSARQVPLAIRTRLDGRSAA